MSRKQLKVDFSVLGCAGLMALTAVTGFILASSKASAEDSATTNASVTVPVACSMAGHTDTAHNASLIPGTYSGASGSEYEQGIGKTTLTTFCNDNNGFSIYAIGFTGDSYDSENHTKLVGTSASGNATIPTKVYESSDTTSNWSMKVTKVDDSTQSYNPANISITNSFNNWHIVPDTYTKVAEYHATTGTSTTDTTLGAKVETTYATYISTTQPADIYTGKVKYTMVHPYTEQPLQPQPSTARCINYFANASNAVGTMGCQSATDNASVTLLASNFSRTGYGFAGWSDKFDYATNPSAHFYGPQEIITAPVGTTANGLSLYAVWVKSQGSLQDQNKVASVCSGLDVAPTDGTANLSSVSALTDQRDNNTYAIARLADGKCWMIENLRLDNSATLTTANTNNPLNDGTNVTLKHSYSDTDTYNNLSASQDPTVTAWCDTDAASCDDQSMLFTGSTTNRASNPTTNEVAMYSYGNYYNWYSATSGNGTLGFSANNNSVAGDLCPAGWRLPIGGSSANASNSQFWQYGLAIMGSAPSSNSYYQRSETNANGDTATKALRKYPNNFLYSGYVSGGSLDARGSYGGYWSSTADSSNYAYNLYLNSSYVRPGTSLGSKYVGHAVRCIAQ